MKKFHVQKVIIMQTDGQLQTIFQMDLVGFFVKSMHLLMQVIKEISRLLDEAYLVLQALIAKQFKCKNVFI